ncbi:MAG TPA: hypothetical protein VH063_07755 [Gaiellaceae bacterium]|jgi:hypothetical protein|nr:hypothetical protein [Gaiellaceae bacterium]
MPVEGQAERLTTPLTRRDRRVVAAIGAVTLIAIVAGALYLGLRGNPAAGPCFTATYPSSMGGATIHHCGSAAVHYCRVDAFEPEVVAACRGAGLAVGNRP